ncbi:MAG TPA: hypothetical protein VIV40_22590 [Kofleriaceae bacterium]
MVRTVFLVMVMLSGCVADAEQTAPDKTVQLQQADLQVVGQHDGAMDVCALAAELAVDDICSLACDPPAMAERMLADGNASGTCYQLYCSLPGDEHVIVGICLPP